MSTGDKSSQGTGPMSPDAETCETWAVTLRGRAGGSNPEMQKETAYPLRGEGRWGGERQFLMGLTSSAAASPARMSVPQVDERDFERLEVASSSSLHGLLENYGPAGSWSRMFQGFTQAMQARISTPSSERLPNSGMAWRGECWIANTSESPSGGVECSLSDILEAHVPQRFYLSAKAARGILRRAEKRGKELPLALQQALEALAMGTATGGTQPTSPTPSKRQTDITDEAVRGETGQTTSLPNPCEQTPTTTPTQEWKPQCTSLVRRLTPTECERLQSFPDGWTLVDTLPSETP